MMWTTGSVKITGVGDVDSTSLGCQLETRCLATRFPPIQHVLRLRKVPSSENWRSHVELQRFSLELVLPATSAAPSLSRPLDTDTSQRSSLFEPSLLFLPRSLTSAESFPASELQPLSKATAHCPPDYSPVVPHALVRRPRWARPQFSVHYTVPFFRICFVCMS